MKYKDKSRSKELMRSEWDKRTVIESDIDNVWYEVVGRNLCIHAIIDGEHIRLPGTMQHMNKIAEEVIENIKVWNM